MHVRIPWKEAYAPHRDGATASLPPSPFPSELRARRYFCFNAPSARNKCVLTALM